MPMTTGQRCKAVLAWRDQGLVVKNVLDKVGDDDLMAAESIANAELQLLDVRRRPDAIGRLCELRNPRLIRDQTKLIVGVDELAPVADDLDRDVIPFPRTPQSAEF